MYTFAAGTTGLGDKINPVLATIRSWRQNKLYMGAQTNSFDAIVVGSGISGGWAAKELTEKGLKTLVIERGRNVEHIKDYTTASMAPWEFPHHLYNTVADREENPVQSTNYNEATKHFFVNDKEHPYIQETQIGRAHV